MYKSPAAPSNLIHIMKSLWRLKSNGPLAYQKHTQTYSATWGFTACTGATWHRWNVCEWKALRANDLSCFLRLPIRIRSGQRGTKGDAVAVERCREFLLCHSEEREIMSALSGLICLIWGQRLRPSVKVGQRGISARRWAQKRFSTWTAPPSGIKRRREALKWTSECVKRLPDINSYSYYNNALLTNIKASKTWN